MNERIKELAAQAKLHMVSEPRMQEFAELIIQECIGVVQNLPAGYKDYRDQIEDAFRNDAVAEIKHKFGIEE